MKILLANKFFFFSGASQLVMFDEMELVRKYELDVVEFIMHDPRNFPSKCETYFLSQNDRRSTLRNGQIALSFIHWRKAVKRVTHLIREKSRTYCIAITINAPRGAAISVLH